MSLKPGDFVRSKRKPEYGYGLVVSVRDDKAEVVFEQTEHARLLLASSLESAEPPDDIRATLARPARGSARPAGGVGAADHPLDMAKLNRLVAAFLAVAEKDGVEKVGDKIQAAFVLRAPNAEMLRRQVRVQLQHWVDTNRSGRHQVAIAPARELYRYLFPDDE